jgi:hypothetical protein
MTQINGTKVSHAVVADAGRVIRGDDATIDDAVARLKRSAAEAMKAAPISKGTQFHFVLTVEKPKL